VDLPIVLKESGVTVEALQKLLDEGGAESAEVVRLTTLDRSPVTAQIGRRTWVSTAVANPFARSEARLRAGEATNETGRPAGAPVARTVRVEQEAGTLVDVRPMVDEQGSIVLELRLERTHPAEGSAAPGEQGEQQPAAVETVTAKTTLRLRPGETKLLLGVEQRSEGRRARQSLVLVTAKTADP
jgi:hypothetical protein